jgi:carboxypeptidase PM20D1
MSMTVFAFVLGLTILIAILLVRAALSTSRQVEPEPMREFKIDTKLISEHLARAIRFKTISYQDPNKFEEKEFLGFHDFLKETFPEVHRQLQVEIISKYSLLYTWKGDDPELKPILLMAHSDVVPLVPGTDDEWTQPPFEGSIADGYIWGRGTMDDKSALMAILEATELLLGEGYRPRRTIYFAFGHDEEVGGKNGAEKIASQLKLRGIEFEFVLDEGGFITEGVVRGVSSPVALVGIAEKGYVSIDLTVEGEVGHSSMPPRNTAIGILSTAIHKLEKNQFPAKIKGPTRQFLRYLAPEMSFAMKMLLTNLWLFSPLVKRIFALSPGTNAGIRNTIAATIFEGGDKENVLPRKARAVVNFRIMPGDSIENVLRHVRKTVKDGRVKLDIQEFFKSEPPPVSSLDSQSFYNLERTIRQVVPEALVVPFLFSGTSDSRHYSEITKNTYRFNPMRIGPEDTTRAHGTNERISINNYEEIVRFYIQLIRGVNRDHLLKGNS